MNRRDRNAGIPVVEPLVAPRFDIEDEEGYNFLERFGFVVFRDVLTASELEEGRSLAWDFLEGIEGADINRNNPKSWENNWPDRYGNGIIVSDGVGQSKFLWFNRGIQRVQRIFSRIWGEDELVTSFDGFCMHRPFEYNQAWHTKTGWYHLDQNGHNKPHRICVQGFVNYYDSDPEDGGLVVVPKSQEIFNEIFKNRPELVSRGDFIPLPATAPNSAWENEIKAAGLVPNKICAKAGDMILWDSRVIHCNSPATTARPLPRDGSILPPRRLVAYVCMTPASRLPQWMIHKRQQAFVDGHTSSHWPEECNSKGRRNNSKYVPPELTEAQLRLIPMDDNNPPVNAVPSAQRAAAPRGGGKQGRGGKPRNKRITPPHK